jgi:transposase
MRKPSYNTVVYEISSYEELEEYIELKLYRLNQQPSNKRSTFLSDDSLRRKISYTEYSFKVFKSGIIKNLDDSVVQTVADESGNMFVLNEEEGTENSNGQNKRRLISSIVWSAYGSKYRTIKEIQIGEVGNGLVHKDGNKSNNSVQNLMLYEPTIEGTELFDHQSYFEEVNCIQDYRAEIINSDNPIILEDFPELQIYQNGNVVDRLGIRSVCISKDGYKYITYKKKSIYIHQLVAMAYLKNEYNYLQVNHIDGNRANNDVNNLEWVNNSFNILHGLLNRKVQTVKNGTYRVVYDLKFRGRLTSKSYRDFIRKKIYEEMELNPDYWIFSNSEPIFLLYLPFLTSCKDFMFSNLLDPEMNILYKTISSYKDVDGKQLNSIQLINIFYRFYDPKDKSDHVVNLLKTIGIEFDVFFDWLFDDLKVLVGDDVGFIYHREFRDYLRVISSSKNAIYLQRVLDNSHISRQRKFRIDLRVLKYNAFSLQNFDRVVEEIEHTNFIDRKKQLVNTHIRNFITADGSGYPNKWRTELNEVFYFWTMNLTDTQWNLLVPIFETISQSNTSHRVTVDNYRPVLNGILWVLGKDTTWNSIPSNFPSAKTCSKYFHEWKDKGIFETILQILAQDLLERGDIDVHECFDEGSFAPTQKGIQILTTLSNTNRARPWQFNTLLLFQSPTLRNWQIPNK